GKPLYSETLRLDAKALAARWGLNRRPVVGSLFAYPADTAQRDAVRSLIGDAPWRGVSLLDGLLTVRASACGTEALRRFFEDVRALLRPDVIGRENLAPRIWAT
ncbi:MAG: urease accessory protein UreD, partial [Gammaproteobacteria bacterium]